MKKLAALFLMSTLLITPALAGDIKVKSNMHIVKNLSVDGTSPLKRQSFRVALSPNTGAAVDSTVYKGMIFPGYAGVVKKITFGCQVAPSVGTDTIKVLKATSSGNTMLSAASFNANTLVAVTPSAGTLTSTAADLALTAAQGIYVEYSAGVQTVDAIDVSVTVEYEPTYTAGQY